MNVGHTSTSSAVVLRVNGREVLTLGDCCRVTQRRDPNSPFMPRGCNGKIPRHPTPPTMYHQQPKWVKSTFSKSAMYRLNQEGGWEQCEHRRKLDYSILAISDTRNKSRYVTLNPVVTPLRGWSILNRVSTMSLSGTLLETLHLLVLKGVMPILNSSHLLMCFIAQRSRGMLICITSTHAVLKSIYAWLQVLFLLQQIAGRVLSGRWEWHYKF